MAAHFGNDMEIGPPEKHSDAYDYANNLRLADKLEGKLLLIHGTADKAVPFAHTMKMVDALTKADKVYDLLVMPGQGHPVEPQVRDYAHDAIRRYFQENLKP